ncbi:uncharacterized protein [Choristoneura fumiferana]|uniref:uncharacterized protein n=1 Tax=Choristoneura fumiferana TaxID=7141 RepID=UPI003D15EDD9
MKRSRAPNFTASEVTHLMSLIEKYPIIESKKIDGATVKEKHEAWQKLTVEYNSQTNYLARTPENLLACYKNQKIKLKKAHSSDKMTIRVEDHGLDGRHVPEAINQNIPDQLGFNQLDKEVKKEVDSTEGSPPASPSYSDSVLERDKTLTGPSSEEDGEFKDQQHMHILPIEFPVGNSRQIENGNERKASQSFLEFSGEKRDLVKAQKDLLDLQIRLQQLEIRLTEEKLDFERKKNKIELDFLTQKYELELNYLKNKIQD